MQRTFCYTLWRLCKCLSWGHWLLKLHWHSPSLVLELQRNRFIRSAGDQEKIQCWRYIDAHTYIFVLWRYYLLIFRERGMEEEREGEKQQCVRETSIGCLSHAPHQGPGPPPRHVSWPRDLSLWGTTPTHCTMPVRATHIFGQMDTASGCTWPCPPITNP